MMKRMWPMVTVGEMVKVKVTYKWYFNSYPISLQVHGRLGAETTEPAHGGATRQITKGTGIRTPALVLQRWSIGNCTEMFGREEYCSVRGNAQMRSLSPGIHLQAL